MLRAHTMLFPFLDSLEPVYRGASHVEESEKAYLIALEAPGFRKEDLNIRIESQHLVIEGQRKGRLPGLLKKVFTLPEDVDQGAIEAQVRDGVLELALPKKESLRPRVIPVQEAKEGFFQTLLGSQPSKP